MAWTAERVEAIYKALHALMPRLPEFGTRVVPSDEFTRILFDIQRRRTAVDRAAIAIDQKLGEQRREVELAKQNLRLAEVWAQEQPSIINARTVAERRRALDSMTHPERTALAAAVAQRHRLESVKSAIDSTIKSLENARITVNSAVNLAIAEMKLTRSN